MSELGGSTIKVPMIVLKTTAIRGVRREWLWLGDFLGKYFIKYHEKNVNFIFFGFRLWKNVPKQRAIKKTCYSHGDILTVNHTFRCSFRGSEICQRMGLCQWKTFVSKIFWRHKNLSTKAMMSMSGVTTVFDIFGWGQRILGVILNSGVNHQNWGRFTNFEESITNFGVNPLNGPVPNGRYL